MANNIVLRVLKGGVQEWNSWKKGPKYTGDFRDIINERRMDAIRLNADLSYMDTSFLREFSFDRFVESYYPHPGETQEMYDAYKADEMSFELQKHGWMKLDDVNFNSTNLSHSDLSNISLRNANLRNANLSYCDLSSADLSGADFSGANLVGANLNSANLTKANFAEADLSNVTAISGDFYGADLTRANLLNANLLNANLQRSILVETNLESTDITGCRIYGVSTWNLIIKNSSQTDLVISPDSEPNITTDNLEVAQFLYLILRNDKIRQVIDTITSKVVLILGRFTLERKEILDILRKELRNRNYLPILFDFEKPLNRDLTETISTLAHMSRFIVADLTDATSIPQELLQIIPDLPSVPVQPILLSSQNEYAMFEHFRRYPWVLDVFLYQNNSALVDALSNKIIVPAELKAAEMTRGKYENIEFKKTIAQH